MKNRLVGTFSMLLLSSMSLLAANPSIRIMPLGDSITYGSGSTGGGYRAPLYALLTNANFNVDYVGTQTGNPTNTLPDSDHEGHGGWWISNASGTGLYENILGWFESILDPHIVLLHIGTNDTGNPTTFTNSTEKAVDRLDKLVTRIAQYQPSARIIVTTLMLRGEPNCSYITNFFNPYVEGKVNAQRALGRNVYFLDMNKYVPLSDMPDKLHPNNTGYAKMAEAWFTAITNIVPDPSAVWTNQSVVLTNVVNSTHKTVTVYFNTQMDAASAANLANYTFSSNLVPASITLASDKKSVAFAFDQPIDVGSYTLTISGVQDVTQLYTVDTTTGVVVPNFNGAVNNVPASEFNAYSLVYSLSLPTSAAYLNMDPVYSVDNSAKMPPFSRVAYYFELQKTGEDVQYVWVSMDAFTNRADKLGVPTIGCGTIYDQYVNNLMVYSNVKGVPTGSRTRGNIEFWPYNYSQGTKLGVPNASGSIYDVDDSCSYSWNYGSMQVHDSASLTPLIAFNNWGGSNTSILNDLGIGSSSNDLTVAGRSTDWTFANNSGTFSVRLLQVYVKCDGSLATPPTVLSAVRGVSGQMIQVNFSEPMARSSVSAADFSLSSGEVVSASLCDDWRTVRLVTSPLPEDKTVSLTVSGIREASPAMLAIAPVTLTVPKVSMPEEVAADVGSLAEGYDLVYTLDIPVRSDTFYGNAEFYRYNDSAYWTNFDRIGYYLELVSVSGARTYLWTSMDAFTNQIKNVGIPFRSNGWYSKQYVSNLDVKSNVASITNGTSMTGGLIEFTYMDYANGNSFGLDGANSSKYDFDDTLNTWGSYSCMQVHNSAAKQTLFAMNDFGGSGKTLDLGIGNSTGDQPDWTFAANASSYKKRLLHVFVRPCVKEIPVPEEVSSRVPDIAGYQHLYTIDIPAKAYFNLDTNNDSYYTVNNLSEIGPNFSRVGYFFELVSGTATQWVWTAMDAFTQDPTKLGVPRTNCQFRVFVNNLDVLSNVAGVTSVTNSPTGNIEFTWTDYSAGNSLNVPDASSSAYDFGDNFSIGPYGYGCMQVHNWGAKQTVFAINNFTRGSTPCVGIGSRNSDTPDWTFYTNAGNYSIRRLFVFVKAGLNLSSALAFPVLRRVRASRDRSKIALVFSKQMRASAADPSAYSVTNAGITVDSATLSQDGTCVLLGVSSLASVSAGAVKTVKPIYDTAYPSNMLPQGTTVAFTVPDTSYATPSIYRVDEIGEYELVYALNAIPTGYNYSSIGYPYDLDESPFLDGVAFDRVAYCLDMVDSNNVERGVFVSMDAFSSEISKLGLPTVERGNSLFQQKVANMNVYAWTSDGSAPAVTTGKGIQTGNIEMWPGSYSQAMTLLLPNASSAVFDFDDYTDNNASNAGHGCFQIHNWGERQTVLSISHLSGIIGIGIGNNPKWSNNDPDYTFTGNAPSIPTRRFFAFIRRGKKAANSLTYSRGTPPAFVAQPTPSRVRVACGTRLTLTCNSPDATAYQWRRNGIPVLNGNQATLTIPCLLKADSGTYDVIAYKNFVNYGTSLQSSEVVVFEKGTVVMLK